MSSASTGAFAAAFRERKQKQRRRILSRWGLVLGIVLLVLFLVWLITLSPVFRVHNVTVQGTELVSKVEVLNAAIVPHDASMISLDTGEIAARVAELPAVLEVVVSRNLPSTVLIDVTERAVVFQRVEGGTFQWVDETGVIFWTSTTPADDAVRAVTADKDPRVLADVAEVVSHIPADVLDRLELVQAKAVDRITLQLDEGDLVVWGSAEQSELKADVLEVLLPSVDAKVYDVSAPSYPTTR